jgi:diguanylate cyclase (GGDEF)-like protein/PAS domain S-box-containing protein
VVPDPVSHELVLDGLPDPVLLVDCMGTVEWANPAAEDQLGHDVSRWRGHNVLEAVHPDDIDVALSAFASMADREAGTSGLLLALRVRHGNGHWIPIELRGRAIVTDGERRIVLVARNVSDRHRTAMDGGDPVLLRALVHHSSAVLILLDRDFCVRSASTEMTRLLHRDLRGTVGTRLTSFVAAHDRETIEDLLNKLGPLSGQAVAEADFLTTRDSTVRLSLTISDLRQDETVDGVLVSGVDVTALRRTEAALRQLAEIDTLTGLLNRATLMQRIHRLSLSAAPEPLAVLFCDLDGFKQVNDQLGHAAGDLVLQDVATRLQRCVHSDDLLARLGGDEFVVILSNCDLSGAERVAERIQTAMESPFLPFGHLVNVGISIGVAGAAEWSSVEPLLESADANMYEAKRSRRG